MYATFFHLNFKSSNLTSPVGVDLNLSLATEQSTLDQVPSYGLQICTNDFNFDELFCDPEDATPELSGASKSQRRTLTGGR
jgi:hypothetical protein